MKRPVRHTLAITGIATGNFALTVVVIFVAMGMGPRMDPPWWYGVADIAICTLMWILCPLFMLGSFLPDWFAESSFLQFIINSILWASVVYAVANHFRHRKAKRTVEQAESTVPVKAALSASSPVRLTRDVL